MADRVSLKVDSVNQSLWQRVNQPDTDLNLQEIMTGIYAPDADRLNHIYQTVKQSIPEVELLTGYEGNAFASNGDLKKDLLAITAVHPMRKEAVQTLLNKTKTSWNIVRDLIERNEIRELEYNGNTFYLRAYKRKFK